MDLKANGFALLRSWEAGRSTRSLLGARGTVLEIPGVETVQSLVPKTADESAPNLYSGNFGLDVFPLHTDLAHWFRPPRYLVLRAVCGSPVVKTYLLDGYFVVDSFGAERLGRTLVQPRRPIKGRRPLLKLLERVSPHTLLRWDSLFLTAATQSSQRTMADLEQELSALSLRDVTLAEPADTLLIDNWRMLHGRGPVPPVGRDRIIERIYLGGFK